MLQHVPKLYFHERIARSSEVATMGVLPLIFLLGCSLISLLPEGEAASLDGVKEDVMRELLALFRGGVAEDAVQQQQTRQKSLWENRNNDNGFGDLRNDNIGNGDNWGNRDGNNWDYYNGNGAYWYYGNDDNGGGDNGGGGNGDDGSEGGGDGGGDNVGGGNGGEGNGNGGNSSSGECGISSVSDRILGGTTSSLGQWPWQARINIEFGQDVAQCGGTLLSGEWVVSASHCIENKGQWMTDGNKMTLHFGETNVNDVEPTEVKVHAAKIIVNPERTIPTSESDTEPHDIIMIKLDRKLTLNENINIACLPSSTDPVPAGTDCYVSGYGLLGTGTGESSIQLMDVKVQILKKTTCDRFHGASGFTSDYICAGSNSVLVDACQGDSGGPLVCASSNGRYAVEGIVSFGPACADQEVTPGAYASIRAHLSWIKDTMANN